jgi:hypothetical protein
MKVLLQYIAGVWLVINDGNVIARVSDAWHFTTLTRVKGWEIINKDALPSSVQDTL